MNRRFNVPSGSEALRTEAQMATVCQRSVRSRPIGQQALVTYNRMDTLGLRPRPTGPSITNPDIR